MRTRIRPFAAKMVVAALTVLLAGATLAGAQQFSFTTLAGPADSPGHLDGAGSAARFYYPNGVAVDSAVNVYVADTDNHTIRKITPGGMVSTLAGLAQDTDGDAVSDGDYADGTGSAARFNYPSGVAVDGADNVYVAEFRSHTIRKMTPSGVVSTLAGQACNSGSADGVGSSARFNGPCGVALDRTGNVYVADGGNHTIRKITPSGMVSTWAGLAGRSGSADETGSDARFNGPGGVAVDSAGNVYVADGGNNTIRKITPAGSVSTLAGLAPGSGNIDGTGSAARFIGPSGVAVDQAGNIYVADRFNQTIRKITPGGVVSTLAGLAGSTGSTDGTGSDARFASPSDVAVDSTGNVYVADSGNSTIRKMTSGGVVSTLAGLANLSNLGSDDGASTAARFHSPSGVAVDSVGDLYVGDTENHTIRKITPSGVVSTLAGLAGSSGSANGTGSGARFNGPSGVAVDSAGNVNVGDTQNHVIRKITPGGAVSVLAGLADGPGSANGTGSGARFESPTGVTVDSAGTVYVADTGNHTIRKITRGGVVSTLAGLAGNDGNADGPGSAARFRSPIGVAVDSSGNVYVADGANPAIRKITPGGVVSTLAGLFGSCPWQYFGPRGVAVDSVGNVYVGDTRNHMIQRITPGGVVSTLAGSHAGNADGTGFIAQFQFPSSLAVDSAGNVYVADTGNHTIRMGTPVLITQPIFESNSSVQLSNGQFQFQVTASINQLVLIQAASELAATGWITLQTATLSTGHITITDPHASRFPLRFYRAVSPVP